MMPLFSSSTGRPVLKDFLIAFIATLLTAGICFPLTSTIGYQTVGLIFLMIVSVLSLFLGRWALIFAAVLNFAVWNFFFITPLYTFRVHSFHDLIALFANLLVAIVGSTLITRIRKGQERVTILLSFLESLNNATSIKEVVKSAQEGLQKYFDIRLIIYLKEKYINELAGRVFGDHELHSEPLFTMAQAIFLHPAEMPLFPWKEPGARIYLFPLAQPRKSIGMIGIRFPENKPPEKEKIQFVNSFITQIASGLEREMNIDLAKEKELYSESEKLFKTVLNSVSHELKTPISIITAAMSNLNDAKYSDKPEIRKQIGEELEFASNRLNHLVENILEMTRIESGFLTLNYQFCDITDVIGIAVKEVKIFFRGHQVKINTNDDIPLIQADNNLLSQALVNVLHNAVIYSPRGSTIYISCGYFPPDHIYIKVTDQGSGIPPEYLHQVFTKFFRVPGSVSGGTGLGLAITKAIIEAHGGSVSADNIAGGGSQITLKLPIEKYHGTDKK